MTLKIEINMDNAAFDNGGSSEVARILRNLSGSIESNESGEFEFCLMDINGNTVGKSQIID